MSCFTRPLSWPTTFTPVEQKLRDEGFELYREHFPWGDTPAFRDATQRVRFVVEGSRVLKPSELLAELLRDWRPVARDEWEYAAGRMRHDLQAMKE